MRLGLQLGYDDPVTYAALAAGGRPPRLPLRLDVRGLRHGRRVTPLAWIAAHAPERSGSARAIMQMPARSPAATATTVATLDLLSGGRVLLGLGTSGPQVAEGWHGQPWGKPLTRTREYVEIVRTILRRDAPLEHHGEHYDIPYSGPDATGLGKPLKIIVHPPRADVPIYLAAIGPKNVALAAEIADGWLPIFFSPERCAETHLPRLEEGFARRGGRPDGLGPRAARAGRGGRRRRGLRATSSSRCSRCTSAAWALAGRTSTTGSRSGTGSRSEAARDPGSLPRRQEAGSRGRGAGRARGRDRARRRPRPDRRPAGRLAGMRRDDARSCRPGSPRRCSLAAELVL